MNVEGDRTDRTIRSCVAGCGCFCFVFLLSTKRMSRVGESVGEGEGPERGETSERRAEADSRQSHVDFP